MKANMQVVEEKKNTGKLSKEIQEYIAFYEENDYCNNFDKKPGKVRSALLIRLMPTCDCEAC